MQRDARQVEAGLVAKGFQRREGHHHSFVYQTAAGQRTDIRTRTSHNGQDIGNSLLGQMARQVRVSKADFLGLVDCPLSREAYEAKVGL